MRHSYKKQILTLFLLLCMLMFTQPTTAATVLWKAPNTQVYLGMNFSSLEFEDPLTGTERVRGYRVIEWRDADYQPASASRYEDWLRSGTGIGTVDGNVNEVWMRQAGQAISTNTTVWGSLLSIHLVGDNNDGLADVFVNGQIVAKLDMWANSPPSQTVCIMVRTTYGLHTIKVAAAGPSQIGPSYAADVAVLGACVLNRYPKWFNRYWFLDARIRLVRTRGWVTVPTGFWGGWYWWRWPGGLVDYPYSWNYPYMGPGNWYWRYCYRYPYWHYWQHWPYYRYYKPWWCHWRWRGWPYFWGFQDRLTYRYSYYRPRITYWWSWYWDPEGQGNCLELVTMADEDDPGGRKIRPLDPELLDPAMFEVGDHEFSVNGGAAEGTFTQLEFIPVLELENYLRSVAPDISEDDVTAFMESDIVQQLMSDPGSAAEGMVGVQYAQWQHPESELEIITDGELVVSENDLFPIQYSVALFNQPELPVTVQVLADSDRVDLGAGPGEPITLHFDPDNWTDLKTITVMPLDDNIPNGEIPVRISHEIMDYTGTESPRGVPLEILLKDDETCEELLDGDVNHDLCVNLLDLAIVARDWLECAPCYNQGRTVGYWTFDYDVSTDSSGNGNDLDPIGSPTLVEGKIGNAVELNGSNGYLSGSADALNGSSDYLKVGQTNAGLDFAPDSFSVSVWVKATSVTGQWQGILEYCRKTPDNPAIYGTNWFGAWLSSTAKFHFRVGSDTIDSTQTLDPDRWYLLTAVYNSSNDEMSLYLDGEHDNTEARSIPTYYFTAPSQAKLTVGTAGENEDEYFTGMLDNIRVYNGILSETEIKGLYQRGN